MFSSLLSLKSGGGSPTIDSSSIVFVRMKSLTSGTGAGLSPLINSIKRSGSRLDVLAGFLPLHGQTAKIERGSQLSPSAIRRAASLPAVGLRVLEVILQFRLKGSHSRYLKFTFTLFNFGDVLIQCDLLHTGCETGLGKTLALTGKKAPDRRGWECEDLMRWNVALVRVVAN
ncbi:hypothetical protein JZ751_007182 [Albula glossodonta]|uniref:Uncharacterized protein n=1 Tax=Albula glossodonta TaxID=121402 RepID=A0A8T2P572_9TELE|nr:hypothetical protein JZ751_007182 [Albula glossodonta]